MTSALLFSTIEVTRQAFFRTSLSYAIVNLKPLVPGREEDSSWMSRSGPLDTHLLQMSW